MMRKGIHLVLLLVSSNLLGQTYIYEDFNYSSFDVLDSLFVNESRKLDWTTHHASDKIDINENGILDSVEVFKKTTIVDDPLNYNNKVIRFELNRVDPVFYAQHFCDDAKNNNSIAIEQAEQKFDATTNAVCTDCSQSPLGESFPEYKTHMNRNEIALGTKARRKAYKKNRTYWFGLRMLLDESYELDMTQNSDLVTQFIFEQKSTAKNPPIALLIDNGRFRLVLTRENGESFDYFDLGPATKNEWINWKFHINISSKDKNAILNVWRDNELLASVKGKNTTVNGRYFFKIGIYKWGWWDCGANASTTERKIIYFDDVWVSKKDNSSIYRQ